MLELLLVPNELNSHDFFGLVVEAFESLAEAALAEEL